MTHQRQKVMISSWNLTVKIYSIDYIPKNFTFFCGFSESCQLLVLRW